MVMKKTMGGSVCAVEWVMVILALIASSVTVNATITCQDAILKLLPCEPYLLGIGDITVPCCQGAQNLNQMVNSTADRRAVCACFNQVGPSLGVNVDRAKKLPDLCKIDLGGITIDFTIDCSTIPFKERKDMAMKKMMGESVCVLGLVMVVLAAIASSMTSLIDGILEFVSKGAPCVSRTNLG
ncbi:hypothetical protein LOK49_LG09G01463 [Camellia lanceoleosa]|uniref:Uncharacterized protein n=1 Tax=Camellia lanceoleosa TaxID=1840588 RepID=A0ACC0GJ09_9ERIC|nr:hypothetical protein LOK49_LG09G01463 [Camellia lanceoleosa]